MMMVQRRTRANGKRRRRSTWEEAFKLDPKGAGKEKWRGNTKPKISSGTTNKIVLPGIGVVADRADSQWKRLSTRHLSCSCENIESM